jgi:glycosyltransferase involved in cell wall biosynthesis
VVPVRVALIAPARYPIVEPYAGGMESHTAELARRLRDLGHHVTVFGLHGSAPDLVAPADELVAPQFSLAAQNDVSAVPRSFMAEHHAYLALMLRLQRAPHRFDVVHDNALHYLTLSLASTLPMPTVATLHTPPTTWFESAVAAGPPSSTTFCAVSRGNARSWRDQLGPLPVIYNGVDTEVFTPGTGGGPAVWTGRLVPEKGAEHAIAAARLAGLPLVLAGPIADAAWFERGVAPLLGGDVRYAGHLNQRQLAELVGRASVAVVTPRWNEPYGLVAAEALACGTPVAAYDRGAVAELLDGQTGRLAPADDVAHLADAMRSAQGLDRRAARQRAVERWSSARMAREYAALYASVINPEPIHRLELPHAHPRPRRELTHPPTASDR